MNSNKLCLGTVQLGLNYGINNKKGKPSKEEALSILDRAVAMGIQYFDTAAAYGNAEEIIGDFILSRGLQDSVKVISKLRPNLINDESGDAVQIILREVKLSLERLNLNSLEGFLLHTPTDFYVTRVLEGLAEAKRRNLVKNIGVSIYETHDAIEVVKSGLVDFIQIPFNVFDQRMDHNDFFTLANKNNIKVFARSPFLQGLLFMNPEEVPEHLNQAQVHLCDFIEVITRYGLSRAEATIQLSCRHPGIDYVVFGVDSLRQLDEDIIASRNDSSQAECFEELKSMFLNMEKEIIFPSLWARK